MSRSVVLIHGAGASSACWQTWQNRLERAGYECLAPAWPFHGRPPAEQRRHPDPRLATLTVGAILDHYAGIIAGLPAPPILIGHSFGGLLVQLLLDRGLGAAGVGIGALPPRHALPGPRQPWFLLTAILALRDWSRTPLLSRSFFRSRVAQTLPPAERDAACERYLVPTGRSLMVEAALGIGTGVDFANPRRAPLLLVSGEEDRIVKPDMTRALFRAHLASPVETALRLLPRRSHWVLTEPGWEQVADFCVAWADTRSPRP
ncbi:MAG TPA: alpha/beta fold hydrolase [Hypericibacter adhaerens]|nr:alpha/beta fold hydrolase [Hypericibacter adhaerens]HWA46575.1 alpha/beta fold hydrolase [Hypericibacter adhaerens]